MDATNDPKAVMPEVTKSSTKAVPEVGTTPEATAQAVAPEASKVVLEVGTIPEAPKVAPSAVQLVAMKEIEQAAPPQGAPPSKRLKIITLPNGDMITIHDSDRYNTIVQKLKHFIENMTKKYDSLHCVNLVHPSIIDVNTLAPNLYVDAKGTYSTWYKNTRNYDKLFGNYFDGHQYDLTLSFIWQYIMGTEMKKCIFEIVSKYDSKTAISLNVNYDTQKMLKFDIFLRFMIDIVGNKGNFDENRQKFAWIRSNIFNENNDVVEKVIEKPKEPTKPAKRKLDEKYCKGLDDIADSKSSVKPVAKTFTKAQKKEHCHKIKMCKYWLSGNCKSGDECTYAHGDHELKDYSSEKKTRHSKPKHVKHTEHVEHAEHYPPSYPPPPYGYYYSYGYPHPYHDPYHRR